MTAGLSDARSCSEHRGGGVGAASPWGGGSGGGLPYLWRMAVWGLPSPWGVAVWGLLSPWRVAVWGLLSPWGAGHLPWKLFVSRSPLPQATPTQGRLGKLTIRGGVWGAPSLP